MSDHTCTDSDRAISATAAVPCCRAGEDDYLRAKTREWQRLWNESEVELDALRTALDASVRNANGMYERLAVVRRYVDDPGNWSALDGRRATILALLDGTAAP